MINREGYHIQKERLKPSPRQIEFLREIANGKSLKQIAFERNITLQTVKNQVREAKDRLNAYNRPHAIMLAIRKGYIDYETING